MGEATPTVTAGNGRHPIPIVAIAAPDLAAATAFYSKLFGWRIAPFSSEMAAATTPAGPSVSLLANVAEIPQGTVPFIGASDVDEALARAVSAGGSVDRAAWDVAPVGRFARFRDPSGTVYGLTSGAAPAGVPPIPVPFGSNPRPPQGTLCSIEMYAADGGAAARYFGDVFGWGAREMMPQYMSFDPGAGIAGVFQSHTPQAPAMAYVYVADAAAKIAEIEGAGGARLGDPMPVPGLGTFGYFKDVCGTAMGVIGP